MRVVPVGMLSRRGAVLLAVVPVVFALSSCNRSTEEAAPAGTEAVPSATAPAASGQSQVERGRLLVVGGACHDCHTPKVFNNGVPEADMSKLLSGHPESAGAVPPFKGDGGPYSTHTNDHLTAWSGAWGVSYAANLTPDQNTGLGIWTEDMFLNAMKQGKHMGTARPILPPMPWMYYGQLPDEDLRAMFAYLKSIPAVANRVPVPLGPDGKPIEEPQ